MRGDASLCIFSSAIDAVRAAVQFQSRIEPRRRVKFRIGVHLGDVIEGFDNDVFGASVNVVARIEDMADPGGVCVSNVVYESVKKKLSLHFEPSGNLSIKHAGEVIKTYRVVLPQAGSEPS